MAPTGNLQITDELRRKIAQQITGFLPGTQMQIPSALKEAQLAESFKIWELNIKRLLDPSQTPSLDHLASSDAGCWHHQVFFNGEPQAYAKSCLTDEGELSVQRLTVSPVAKEIHEAIDQIDKYSGEVRLLTALPFRVYAFWLIDKKDVYLIDAPATFLSLHPYLKHFLDETAFVKKLRADVQEVHERQQKPTRTE